MNRTRHLGGLYPPGLHHRLQQRGANVGLRPAKDHVAIPTAPAK